MTDFLITLFYASGVALIPSMGISFLVHGEIPTGPAKQWVPRAIGHGAVAAAIVAIGATLLSYL